MTAPSVEKIFEINSEQEFNERCLEVFHYQARENAVYREYLALLGVNATEINGVEDIPVLPIELFKSHKITSGESDREGNYF